ncbi:MAG TPA: sugar transferase [Ureibacillus sp.]|nr:sugar transferase [Ureibacillus sp.]
MKKADGIIYKRYIKRPIDILLSLLAIILLSPLFIIVWILVRVKLGSPVIFKQQRPGLNEEIFTIYKFRTMTNETDEHGEFLPDSVRLTRFGRILRSTSLDELPEIFNILKGDMSIVGPRPLAVEYLPYYTEEERKRHSVRPGLTGLAQINGRNSSSWEKRFYYDQQYVQHLTFLGDVRIILKTILVVIRRSDIGEHGVDTPVDLDESRNEIIKIQESNEKIGNPS